MARTDLRARLILNGFDRNSSPPNPFVPPREHTMVEPNHLILERLAPFKFSLPQKVTDLDQTGLVSAV